jgi:hypothetical protein
VALTDSLRKREVVAYVLDSLNRESNAPHIVYLLFLYLVRLDDGSNTSTILLHSIILREHADIKIKKEATRQIESVNQSLAEKSPALVLARYLRDVEHFLAK